MIGIRILRIPIRSRPIRKTANNRMPHGTIPIRKVPPPPPRKIRRTRRTTTPGKILSPKRILIRPRQNRHRVGRNPRRTPRARKTLIVPPPIHNKKMLPRSRTGIRRLLRKRPRRTRTPILRTKIRKILTLKTRKGGLPPRKNPARPLKTPTRNPTRENARATSNSRTSLIAVKIRPTP
jgi:hypothetical protein